MRQTLRIHPDSRCVAVGRIEVEVARPAPGALALGYLVTGAIGDLDIPNPATPARADGLWRRTCFEAFVRPMPGEAYFEFNFAPSGEWAAYGFESYRAAMSSPGGIAAPRIAVRRAAGRFELQVSLELDPLPGVAGEGAWRLGLSAVIEEAGGGKSYWALAHPPGKADFHHAVGLACELPAAERP